MQKLHSHMFRPCHSARQAWTQTLGLPYLVLLISRSCYKQRGVFCLPCQQHVSQVVAASSVTMQKAAVQHHRTVGLNLLMNCAVSRL